MTDQLDLVARVKVEGQQALQELESRITRLSSVLKSIKDQNAGKSGWSAVWGAIPQGLAEGALKGLKDQEKILLQQQQQHPARLRQQREVVTGWKAFREETERASKAVQREMMPALSALGISTLTVGGSVALLVKSLKDFAEAGAEVNRARALEFPEKIYSSWKAAGEAFYIAGDKMDTAFASVSRMRLLMSQLQTRGEFSQKLVFSGLGELVGQIDAINRSNLPTATKNVQTLATILTDLAKIEPHVGASGVRVLLQQIGLPEDLENITKSKTALAEFVETAKAYEKAMGEAVDPAAALQYNIQVGLLRGNLEGLKRALGHELLGPFTKLVTSAKEFVEANKGEVAHGIADSIREIGTAIQETVPLLGQLKTLMEWVEKARQWENEFGEKQRARLGGLFQGGTTTQLVGAFQDYSHGMAVPAQGQPGNTGADIGRMQHYDRGMAVPGLPSPFGMGPTAPLHPAAPEPTTSFWERAFGMGRKPAATRPQMLEGGGIEDSFPPGSLGQGNISTGWRHSTGVEDQRSVEDKIADERTWRGLSDNTREERDNTEQLRRLTEILQGMAGPSNVAMDFGGGGTGAYGHTGSGPMFRPGRRGASPGGVGRGPGIGPGARTGPHVTRPAGLPPKEMMPSHPTHTPGATESPGPSGGTLTQPPASSIPPKELMPGFAEGGVVNRPTVALIGEKGPEAVVPLDEDPSVFGDVGDRSKEAAVRFRNPGAMWPGQASALFGGPRTTGDPGAYQLTDAKRNWIAQFPSAQQGMAAEMWLMAHGPKYEGKTVGEQQSTWSGGNRSTLPGYDPSSKIDPSSSEFIDYMKATANYERGKPYPLTDQQVQRAGEIYKASSGYGWNYDPKTVPAGGFGGGGAGAAHPDWPVYAGVMGGTPAGAVDRMMQLDGLNAYQGNQRAEIMKFLETGGHGMDPARTSWCAATVNSALAQEGLPSLTGDQKEVATQFLKYPGGQVIATEQAQKGDVGVYMRGLPAGALGGHVGMFAGGYDEKSDTLPFMSGNAGKGYAALKNVGKGGLTAIRLPQGHKWDEFQKGNWAPSGAPSSGISGLRTALPSGLREGISSQGASDLSQPGLTSMTGVGPMLGAGAAHGQFTPRNAGQLPPAAMDPNLARSPRDATIQDPGQAGQFTPHDPGKLGGGGGTEHKFSGQGTLNIKVQGPPGTKASGNFSEMVDQKSNGPFRKVNIGHHMLHKADEGN